MGVNKNVRRRVSSNLDIMDDLVVVMGGLDEYYSILVKLVIVPRCCDRVGVELFNIVILDIEYFDTLGDVFMMSISWSGFGGGVEYFDKIVISFDDFLILLKSYNRDLILGGMFD